MSLVSRVAMMTGDVAVTGNGNIPSIGAVHCPKPAAHYKSARAGLLGFTYGMATESARDNIMVNAILPGPINTPPTPSRAGGLPGRSSTTR